MKKVAFYTLGCKVNQYESEAMLEAFQTAGYQQVIFPPQRTCISLILALSLPWPIKNHVRQSESKAYQPFRHDNRYRLLRPDQFKRGGKD